ncbi:MAG: hypothetical protein K8H84_07885 [Sulfuricella denitrificans]|nr:hypothetical protein [Sulfuricella denitrificans]
MSLSQQVGRLHLICQQIKKTSMLEKANLVGQLADEMVQTMADMAQRIEQLERGQDGKA